MFDHLFSMKETLVAPTSPLVVEVSISGVGCGFLRAGAMTQSSGIRRLEQNPAHNKSTNYV